MRASSIAAIPAFLVVAACLPPMRTPEQPPSCTAGGCSSSQDVTSGTTSGAASTGGSSGLASGTSAASGVVVGSSSFAPLSSSSSGTAVNRNDQVRLALEPFCIGCHGDGANHPFFASLPAFESLLVANPAYVVPGDAASSKLTALLRGSGMGGFTQMPPYGMPYATRPDITMPMTEIDAWINEMGGPVMMAAVPDPDAPHIRRMTAEDILRNLYLQLGMTEVDFCGTYYSCGEYGIVANDAIGDKPYIVGGSYQRFDALGGPAWLRGKARNNGLSPTFLQTFTHISQAWCRKAVEKTSGNVILDGVTLADTSASNAAGIQANIRRLYLRMLADVPPEAEVQLLFTDVFQHYESVDTKTAWTAVCTALVRHPKWLFY